MNGILALAPLLLLVSFSSGNVIRDADEDKALEKTSGFCCKVKLHYVNVEKTVRKPVRHSKMRKQRYIVGYGKCPRTNGECPLYKYKQSESVMYRMENVVEKVKEMPPCPPRFLGCCEGLVMYAGSCHEKSDVALLDKLKSFGIIAKP